MPTKKATKKKPAAKPCECIAKVNEQLKEHNAQLVTKMRFKMTTGKYLGEILILQTEKLDSKKRGLMPTVTPSYCPFCGKKIL